MDKTWIRRKGIAITLKWYTDYIASLSHLKVLLGQADEVGIVSAVWVKPENGFGSGGTGTCDCQLDPVLDGEILGLTHPPNITDSHIMLEDDVSRLCAIHPGMDTSFFQFAFRHQ